MNMLLSIILYIHHSITSNITILFLYQNKRSVTRIAMPRKRTYTPVELTERAMHQFWEYGYNATSIDDLVKVTSISRHGIYTEFGGKRELFLACFDSYQDAVVSPAFDAVEQVNANLTDVANYFEFQIRFAESKGLPGPGCFVANSATECAPHDSDIMTKINIHNDRLRRGFITVLNNEFTQDKSLLAADISALADTLVVFTNGLWSASRTVTDANSLRSSANNILNLIKGKLR